MIKLSLALAATLVLASTTADAACPSQPRISQDSLVATLNGLLQAEGLNQVRVASPFVRRVELDNDASTEEALVDVVAPETCDAVGQCMTLVVLSRGGRLVSVGHGRWLAPVDSRTNGWMDVAETHRTLVVFGTVLRTLHFTGARYSSTDATTPAVATAPSCPWASLGLGC